jgi:phosphohistidine phosphatase
MKRVLLLRHAEAMPAQGAQRDIDRPLSERGRAEALAVTQRIAASGLPIDVLYVSPAERTRETGRILAAALAIAGRLRIESALYPGTPESLWATLQRADEQVRCALLIGHNPGLSALARQWRAVSAQAELPTAGLCLAGFPADVRWCALEPAQACPLELPGYSTPQKQ